MRYLITGAGGMLGHELSTALAGREVTALSHADLDVTNAADALAAVANHDVVINAAAYTTVDEAESHEAEAYAINALGAANLAAAAAQHAATLVQISTDYVFDGTATTPYAEDAPVNPLSAYGRTKAEGEKLALDAHPGGTIIVRTAWLYGAYGHNFVRTMLRLAEAREIVSVVSDQIGQPTWAADLAQRIVALLDTGTTSGIYNGTAAGQASWFDFAKAIFQEAGLDPARVEPIDSAHFVRPAKRPTYSVLGHEGWRRVGLTPMRDWRDALAQAADQGLMEFK